MDFPLLIRQRLKELGTEQRDLAAAAQVTESYISQLLTGKKAPPAPERTDIYDRMETFLRLPAGTLATLADLSRMDGLNRRKLADPSAPLSLVTQKLLDVAKRLTKQELNDENWLRSSLDSATEATSRCGSWCLSSWKQMSSTFRPRIASRFWIR